MAPGGWGRVCARVRVNASHVTQGQAAETVVLQDLGGEREIFGVLAPSDGGVCSVTTEPNPRDALASKRLPNAHADTRSPFSVLPSPPQVVSVFVTAPDPKRSFPCARPIPPERARGGVWEFVRPVSVSVSVQSARWGERGAGARGWRWKGRAGRAGSGRARAHCMGRQIWREGGGSVQGPLFDGISSPC